jgi:hypothetical protein
MAVLSTQQRNTLESAVKQARKVAEQGAYNALHAMAVDHAEPFAHMDATERSLRNSLRSKARLLGDELKANSEQAIHHLSYELAYETWHKMLFANFLEANHLLMHPDGVAVTMEDCEELGKEEGYADKWDAAANYASRMLPAIFRVDDPLMKVGYATDDRIKLESIIEGLENSIFTADDALGWVYQFWQSEAKATINASGDKIDGEKLPAVTQLFTEPYMVHFLIDNTLGAWWVSRNPGVRPPVKFEYLRMHKPDTEPVEVPAAGKFEGWPDKTAEVTSLDPCMGSGHFVASLFPVFAALRMQEEGLTKEQATDKVIAENLHGLELDARCTQIAAFNLALTAWKFCGHYKELPEMNLACSGIAPKGKVEDWIKLVGNVKDSVEKARMENGMKMLYEHFQLAPELGSLLDPTTIKADAFTASFDELQPVLKRALDNEDDSDQVERGVMATGIARAGQLLAKNYFLQITNVPYVKKGKLSPVIAGYLESNFPNSKEALETVFLEKMLIKNNIGGISCSVIPQNWLFLTSYKRFRENLLKYKLWNFVARLGVKAFKTPMWDFNIMLISIQNKAPQPENKIIGFDVSDASNVSEKEDLLRDCNLKIVNQKKQLTNVDATIMFEEISRFPTLSNYAVSHQGAHTFDIARFRLYFWEMNSCMENWRFHSSSPSGLNTYSGFHYVSYKREDGNEFGQIIKAIANDPNETRSVMWKAGHKAWGKFGISCSWMGNLPVSLYIGQIFDNSAAAIIPKNIDYLLPIYCFCSSPNFSQEVRKINQKMQVADSTLVKVPFDLEHWQKVANDKYPDGLPKPYSEDLIEWLFHGNPIKTENPLQVALARVMGYRWPAEVDTEIVLSKEGLELTEAVKAFDHLSDEDGIFCIPSVNAEQGGAERLRDYLQEVFKENWNSQTINQLLQKEGANATNLEAWLRDEFFVQHYKVFQNRPFIWQIWDGRKDGFSVLVNYHKLTKDNLSKLIYTYLGDWIRMCEAKKKAGESGAEGLLSAALKLKERLEAILEGEAPYDIFVRWKPLEQQPIGWEPDLNDGVRLNIRPFIEADVLRKKPNIKWGVDRGKNPPGSPWGEIRDNDKRLSLDEKRTAREKAKK